MAAAAVAALLAAGGCPGSAAAACSSARPTVELVHRIPLPQLDNTLPQPALQRLSGEPFLGGRVLGLYKSQLLAEAQTTVVRTEGRDGVCVAISHVTLTISMPERTIYIVRERRPGTCEYAAVLGHERKHQAVDDEVLGLELLRVRQDMERTLARQPASFPWSRQAAVGAEQRLFHLAEESLRDAMDRLNAIKSERQAAVDTPEEYRRVAAACASY